MNAGSGAEPAVVLQDDLLPGVGAEQIGLRETLRHGGLAIAMLAVPLTIMEQLAGGTTGTLGPDIRDYFGISDAALAGLAGFSGVALTLGGIPVAWLANRMPRKHLVVISATMGALALAGAGLAQETWQLFIAFTLTGLAAAYSLPVFGSMIADAYPVGGRGKVFALQAMATPLGQAVGPVIAGSIVLATGSAPESWRWAYVGLALPYAALAVLATIFMREPARGESDSGALPGADGETAGTAPERPVGVLRAFGHMLQVRTFLFMCLGIGTLGLALFTIPVQFSLLLGDEYGLDAFSRGLFFTLSQVPVIITMIIAGRVFDGAYRRRPEWTVWIAGGSILLFGALFVGGVWLRPLGPLLAAYVLAMMFNGIALVAVNPLVASVTPYRIRAQAFAFVPVFTFLMGGFFGSIFAGVISGEFGSRVALTIAVSFSAFVAGLLFLRAGKHLRRDIAAAVEELAGGKKSAGPASEPVAG